MPARVRGRDLPASPAGLARNPDGSLALEWRPVDLPEFERRPEQTDAQWAVTRTDRQWQREFFGIMRALFQEVRTRQGAASACGLRRCRRLRRCASIRPQSEPFEVLDIVPPCAPADEESFFALRDAMKLLIAEITRTDAGE